MLGLVFLIDQGVPNMQTQLTIRMKKAAFIFKKRYWETYAERRWRAPRSAATAGRGAARRRLPAARPRRLRRRLALGLNVSDAYES